jgi:hypothetical protein
MADATTNLRAGVPSGSTTEAKVNQAHQTIHQAHANHDAVNHQNPGGPPMCETPSPQAQK